ncbi:hypothetical protein TSOC_001195 [Tetrabaena socialis]|uniref:Uncharacterized protein n=1 Tax=Tetrabaena socialis TaxID=47790 RepID=A0A2J8AHA8_9CHLO|nr:hypothetical protein TSOC_001195 [Tetrabaena socialis]|eukprot:PNH11899.1 hypothetical protein TSOC_001195 [Tetrabaena socialis]
MASGYAPGEAAETAPGAIPGGSTPGGSTPGGGGMVLDDKQSKRIAEGVNEEYHDPYDDWSSRDTLLAFIPLIMAFALQDGAFRVGLVIALSAAGFLLVMRTVAWDSRYKKVWPIVELISVPLFAILLGLSYVNFYQVNKWFPTIALLTFWLTFVISLAWRRPFTAHYARYPKFDRGGSLLWRHTPNWRRTSDIATAGWIVAITVVVCLTLIPELTGNHRGRNALNIIFNYIVPAIGGLAALLFQQMLGNRYRSSTVRNLDSYFGRSHISQVPGTGTMGAMRETYPAGPTEAAAPATV